MFVQQNGQYLFTVADQTLLVYSHKNLATPVQSLPLHDDSHFNAGMLAGDCLYLSIWKTLYIYQL
jgi:hypothetical protein